MKSIETRELHKGAMFFNTFGALSSRYMQPLICVTTSIADIAWSEKGDAVYIMAVLSKEDDITAEYNLAHMSLIILGLQTISHHSHSQLKEDQISFIKI